MTLEKKICSEEKSDLETYKDNKIRELILDKAYGGYEAKIEEGRLVHFKYWVSKKL